MKMMGNRVCTDVIIVADDDTEALKDARVPSCLLHLLDDNGVLFSNDNSKMFVRASAWERMKEDFTLAN